MYHVNKSLVCRLKKTGNKWYLRDNSTKKTVRERAQWHIQTDILEFSLNVFTDFGDKNICH